ncbi:hypothetical protein OAP18_00435 [Gammaproteobacteria bacterium]|nr:hypothetical protein [Gammaproteobacteria bacterium]
MDNNKLLLELDKHRREVNKKTINPVVEKVNLETLKPIVTMVAKARAAYLTDLLELANKHTDTSPSIEQISQLQTKRKVFEELVKATNAFETMIERGYLDIAGTQTS